MFIVNMFFLLFLYFLYLSLHQKHQKKFFVCKNLLNKSDSDSVWNAGRCGLKVHCVTFNYLVTSYLFW